MTTKNIELIEKLRELNPLLENQVCDPEISCEDCIFSIEGEDYLCLLDCMRYFNNEQRGAIK